MVMEGALLAPAHIAERGEVKKSTGQEQGKDANGIASKRASLVIPKSLIAVFSPTLRTDNEQVAISHPRM